jgi:autotransporter passenger strand-loop-strand repeat protein
MSASAGVAGNTACRAVACSASRPAARSTRRLTDGGVEIVSSGGIAGTTTVGNGGTLELFGSAALSGSLALQSGSILEIGSGYGGGFIVSSGKTLEIPSSGTQQHDGAERRHMLILSGGAASGTVNIAAR